MRLVQNMDMPTWAIILLSLLPTKSLINGFQRNQQHQRPLLRALYKSNSVVLRPLREPSVSAVSLSLSTSDDDDESVTETARIPIGELFSERNFIFRTTKNIRGYEWETKEVEELWEDLKDSAFPKVGTEREDFELQQIVLVKAEWNKAKLGLGGRYDIHDGQQRIITVTLILAAIRDSFRREEGEDEIVQKLQQTLYNVKRRKDPLFRIEPREREATMLRRILNPDGMNAEDDQDEAHSSSYNIDFGTLKERKLLDPVDQRIAKNYETLLDFVNELDSEEKLDLFEYIEENVFLLVTTAGTSRMARNMAMGQGKGKNNEAIDDFKGIVCFQCVRDEAEQEDIFSKWDDLYIECGRKTVFDACVLLASAELQERVKKNDEINLLDKWVRWHMSRDDNMNVGGADFFHQIIRPACRTLHNFRTERFDLTCDLPDNGYEAMRAKMRLKFLRVMSKVPTCKEIEGVVLHQLLKPPTAFSDELLEMERLVLWMALTKQTPTRRHQRGILLLERSLKKKRKLSLSLISSEDFALIRSGLDEGIFGAKSPKTIVATALLERLNSELLLQNSQSGMPECMALQLEHILPKKAVGEYWERHYPSPSVEREVWTHRLGNLALLNQKLNAKASNRSFSSKKDIYKESPYPLTKHLVEYADWDTEAIQNRHQELLHQANEVWGM